MNQEPGMIVPQRSVLFDTLTSRSTDELAARLVESWATNARLHRRCQRAEADAHYYAHRYEAIQRPLEDAQGRANGYATALRKLYNAEYRMAWRACLVCRGLWRFKAWVRRW